MANEIGYWDGATGAEQSVLFGDDAIANVAAGTIFTPGSSGTISAVRWYGRSFSGSQTVTVGLYAASGGVPTGALLASTSFAGVGTSAATYTATGLSWAVTAGTPYVLAVTAPAFFYVYGSTVTGGTETNNSAGLSSPWVDGPSKDYSFDLAGDFSGSSSPVLSAATPSAQRNRRHAGRRF